MESTDISPEIKEKLLNGDLDLDEWKAIEALNREQLLAEVIAEAVKKIDQASTGGERVDEGLLLELPDDAVGVTLPPGYALAETGVYRVALVEENGKVKANAKRLTRTPFLIAARDAGSGRVKLLVRLQGVWRSEWVQPSRVSPSKLLDWFILPEPNVKPANILEFARACIAVAPFQVAEDAVAMAAVEILRELFPARAAGVTFPALRDFPSVRQKAEERGIDPIAVRRWWERQGLLMPGPGKVERHGKTTVRMLVFMARVREFLEALPEDKFPREGKLFRVRILSGNGPDVGQEVLIALPGAPVIPLDAWTPGPVSPLAQALAGLHWPGEVVEVRAPQRYSVQILEIDPPLTEPDGREEARAG